MNEATVAADLTRFRELVESKLGLAFDATKDLFLAEVLERRLRALKLTEARYLARLEAAPLARAELAALARELTVAETYFFRNPEQFQALAATALPSRAALGGQQLRLASLACASGEEAYSLAMLTREHPALIGREVVIRAVDVNPAVLEKAARARYSAWALRELAPELRQRWFTSDGAEHVLDSAIRRAVTFEERNLAADDAALWEPAGYDVIFCRNVLMYFSLREAQRLVARLGQALAPGGYLFLGHAETLRGLSQDFHLLHSHGTFYYQRRGAHERAPTRLAAGEVPAIAASLAAGESWMEAVQHAAEHIRALTAAAPQGAVALPTARREERRSPALDRAFDLLQEERFAEALEQLRDLSASQADDSEVMLLRAALLTQRGELAAAEAACRALLERDELHAGAHYLLALCREGAGAFDDAREQDQLAAYLDPTFAMPRLHLGLMARRAGDRESARRELGQALLLLAREEGARLLLFGGGFGREALSALCRAELVAAGGRP